ncbi:MAG: PilZ domain-containing protein [Bdellovibrionota bacterium]
MPADQTRELDPVQSKQIAERYVQFSLECQTPISCWLDNSQYSFPVKAIKLEGNILYIEISPSIFAALEQEGKDALDRAGVPVFVNYSLGEMLIFLKTKLVQRTDLLFGLEIIFPVYKQQRRNSPRIKAAAHHRASLEFLHAAYMVFDISNGGVSILVKADALPFFQPGIKLAKCRVRFQDLDFEVDVKVISQIPMEKKVDLWKIGLIFINLPEATERAITKLTNAQG